LTLKTGGRIKGKRFHIDEAAMATRRPNILVLMPDQHRASAMGCAGDSTVRTPNLDRLAREGVRFGRAYCQGPLCMPARASFLTERYVRDHGVYENSFDVPASMPTFPQRLVEAGYHTSCIGKMHLYVHGTRQVRDTRERAGFLQKLGFAEPIETVGKLAAANIQSEYSDYLQEQGLYDAYRAYIASHAPGRGAVLVNGQAVERIPVWQPEPNPLPAEAYPDNWVGRRVVRWIEQYDRDQPFFQWVGFPGPHNPWDAPQEYVDRYRDVEIRLGTTLPPQMPPAGPLKTFLEAFREHSQSEGLSDEAIRQVRRAYYANLTLIDERIGDILAALERKGILENTWVIYTSDHGEMMGDHRLMMKMVFYEPSVRVPLILRPPRGTTGHAIDGIVEHVDAAATIRAIAGAGPISESAGISLLGHFLPNEPGFTRPAAYSENYGFGMVVTERYKLVVHEDTGMSVQLFDLQLDPSEDRNVVDEPGYAEIRERVEREFIGPFLSRAPLRPGPGLLQRAGHAGA
jgi:arylsulfatase